MRGSVRKRGQTWTAYWSILDADGRRRQRSEGGKRTKREAQNRLTEVLAALQTGTYTEPRKITVGQFMRSEWLPTLTGRPNTVASYTDVAESWVIPYLGGVLLPQLTPRMVQQFLEDLRTTGRRKGEGDLGPRSVAYALAVLKMALGQAVAQGFIPRNPAAGIRRPSSRSKEMSAWSAGEAGQFLASMADDRLYAAWLLFLARGFRRGEIAGLRWTDVDLGAGRISVVHTRVSVRSQATTSTPKTEKGRRTVPLDPKLVAALRDHRRRQLSERLACGEAWEDSGYVFVREDGRPFHPEHFSDAFDRHQRRLGARRIRLHDTRHTAATLSLQAGIPTKVVSEWLGHASVSITEDLYRHAIPSMQEEAGARLTDLILGADQ